MERVDSAAQAQADLAATGYVRTRVDLVDGGQLVVDRLHAEELVVGEHGGHKERQVVRRRAGAHDLALGVGRKLSVCLSVKTTIKTTRLFTFRWRV